MAVVTCPDPADLERLFLGGLPAADADALEQHVLECDACSGRLEQLFRAKETLAVVLCEKTCDESAGHEAVVADLIKKIESLRPAHAHPPQGKPMIAIHCSACQKKLSVKEVLAGKKVKCPVCGQVTVVPAALGVGAAGNEGIGTLPSNAPSQLDLSAAPTHPPLEKPDATVGVEQDSDLDSSLTDFLAPAQAPDELGRLGKYRILKILGHGGMGVVYKAEDPKLERSVAIKAMLPALAASASAGKRFLREAQAMAKVEHDHIVRIYQVDEDRGVPFLAMEFLKGEPLDERLKRNEPLPVDDLLRIGREIADGLAAAHATGLIHRDIKPGNIWLEAPRNRVKILDFGLARAASQDSGLTQQGAIIGTPAYMAPEQGRGENVDARCDLFSLGVVLYRMCTGQQPFVGKDSVSTLLAIAMTAPVAPSQLNRALPPELSELVMKLLEKDPAKRVASAAEVVQAIQAIERKLAMQKMAEEKTEAMNAGDPRHGITAAPKATTGSSPQRPPSRRRPVVLVAVAAVFALFCLLGGGIFYIVTDKGTIEIKTDDKNVKIVVEENGGKITIIDPASKQTWILNTGKYAIRLDGNPEGLEIDLPTDRTFEMKRGGKQVVSIRKVPAPVAKNDPKVERKTDTQPPAEKSHVLRFKGDDSVTIPAIKLDPRGPITIEAYVRCDSVTPGQEFNPFIAGVPGTLTIYLEHDGSDLRAGCRFKDKDFYRIVRKDVWVLGKRLHVAAVRTQNRFTLYVDGKEVGRKELPDGELYIDEQPFRIGGRINGEIGEVRVSKFARYTKTFTPQPRFKPDEDTIALYHCDEGSGDLLKDSSGNAHHGKIVGAKWVKVDGTPIAPTQPGQSPDKEKPFVLVRGGKQAAEFKSFAGVMPEIENGDTIEVHGNGPFEMGKLALQGKNVTLKAAAGYRPRFLPHASAYRGDTYWIKAIDGDLTLEGCDFISRPPAGAPNESLSLIYGRNAAITLRKCRVMALHDTGHVDGKSLNVEDCLLLVNTLPALSAKTECHFQNNVVYSVSSFRLSAPGGQRVTLRNNTFCSWMGWGVGLFAVEPKAKDITITAKGNLFDFAPSNGGIGSPLMGTDWIGNVAWEGRNNLYRGLTHWQQGDKLHKGLDGWAKLTGKPEQGSRETSAAFLYGFERGKNKSMEELRPIIQKATEDARRQNARDVGPDFTLIGPGAAYLKALAGAGKTIRKDELRPEAAVGGACVLLRAGKVAGAFAKLQEAVAQAKNGDTVEVRSDGAFEAFATGLDSGTVTVRAAYGYRPIIENGGVIANRGTVLILEGFHFRDSIVRALPMNDAAADKQPRIGRLANCSFEWSKPQQYNDGLFQGAGKQAGEIVNCWMPFTLSSRGFADTRLTIRNSVLGVTTLIPHDKGPFQVELERCTVWNMGYFMGHSAITILQPMIDGKYGSADVKITAKQTLFESIQPPFHPVNSATRWDGSGNVFRNGTCFLSGTGHFSVATWGAAKNVKEEGSVDADPLVFDPEAWRMLPSSPGFKTAPDGKDFGADVSKIGGAKWVKVEASPLPTVWSLDFDGNGRVDLPSLTLKVDEPLTVEAWVTPRVQTSQKSTVFRVGWISQMISRKWDLWLPQSNPKHKDPWRGFFSDQEFSPGKRTHVAAVWSGKEIDFYVNGQLQGAHDAVMVPKEFNPQFFLGDMFNGQIHQFRVSNVVRNKAGTVPINERFKNDDKTLILYHFDEGQGDVLKDSSGNGHHGKIVGAKWVKVEGTPSAFPPLDPAWLKAVAALPVKEQIEAVKAELIRRNPGTDDKIATFKIDAGVVREVEFRVLNVTDIAPLRALPGLQRLKCRGNSKERAQLADLSPLQGTKLTFLMISFTEVTDLTPIKDLKLTLLHCQGTKISDLSLVKGMPLTELHCGNTGVTDLAPLQGMKLTNLDFVAAGVSDLAPLKGMQLTYLGCHFSKVTDLSPLQGMPLTWIKMESTRVADIAPLRGMPLKTLDISFVPKRDAEILRPITTLETINGQAKEAFWMDVDAKKVGK